MQYLVGDDGVGRFAVNIEKAIHYLSKIAIKGNISAQDALLMCGEKLSLGNDVKQNLKRATEVYLFVAEISFDYSKAFISTNHLGGDSEIVDEFETHEEVVKYYHDEARRIKSETQFRLGECYERGSGVKQNYRIAKQWYERAANNGHKEANKQLKKFS